MAVSVDQVFKLNRMNSLAKEVSLGDLVNIQVYSSSATVGGSATETITVTGLAAADTIIGVSMKTKGANAVSVAGNTTQAANALTVVFTADPGAAAIVRVTVLKAAASY